MKNQTSKTVLFICAFVLALSCIANAKTKVIKPIKYDLFFMNASGTKVDPMAATLGALQGQVFYKCQSVEASITDKGSISAKNTTKNRDE